MKKQMKVAKRLTVAVASLLTFIGCGSSGTSNDQGVSFTLYSLFEDGECDTGLAGAIVPLSVDPEQLGSGGGVVAYLGLQNNLAQGLRTRRAFLKYYVEGATVQPPDTSQALGVFMGPGTETPNSSLPEGFGGGTGAGGSAALGNIACAGIELVPPEILSYLNLNRNTLPEPPYKMRVEIAVSGIGTAGDEYTSNPLDTHIEVVQDNIITPANGETSSTGTTSSAGAVTDDGTGSSGTGLEGEVIPVIPGTDQPADS